MIKHLEVKTYEKTSNCNYNDFSTKLKAYVFVRRGLEYMNGWRNVLSAINYAIDEAQKELEEYLKQKEKENTDLVTDVLMKATDLVKGQKLRKYKKHK